MRIALPTLAVLVALLIGCNRSPAPYLELKPEARFVEVYPNSSTSLKVGVVGRQLTGSVVFGASDLPPGIQAVQEGDQVKFVSGAIAPGAYSFKLTGEAPTISTPVVHQVPLRMFAPTTGNILNESPRPLDVTIKVDDSLAVEVEMTVEGGVVELVVPGTRYTLTVPESALLQTTRLRLTPVMGVDWVGFSSAQGVRLEPADLRLLRLAKLELSFTTPPSANGIFRGFQAESGGQDLYLKSVVQGKIPAVDVTRGGVTGVGWVLAEAIQTTPIPKRPEDRRLERIQRLPQPDEVHLSELTYAASVLARLSRLGLNPQPIGALLPELAIWDADLPTRAWGQLFAGNLGLSWALLAASASKSAEQLGSGCPGDIVSRDELRRWRLATDRVPAWREALGEEGVRLIEATLAACLSPG